MDPYRRARRVLDFLGLLRVTRIARFTGEVFLASVIGLCGAGYLSSRAPPEAKSTPSPSLSDGTYVILSRNDALCLEAPADRSRRGSVSARGCWEATAQDWILTRQAGDEYTLQSSATKSCLDMPWGAMSPRPVQFPCHGNTNQRWRLESRDEGAFALRSAANGQCLTALSPRAPNSAEVSFAKCDSSTSQKWLVTRVTEPQTTSSASEGNAERSPVQPSAREFVVGDRVQVAWNGNDYPASILRVKGPGEYEIHYDGYDKSWDEVVGLDRIHAGGDPARATPPERR